MCEILGGYLNGSALLPVFIQGDLVRSHKMILNLLVAFTLSAGVCLAHGIDLRPFAGTGHDQLHPELKYEVTFNASQAVKRLTGTFQRKVLVEFPNTFETWTYRFTVSRIPQYIDPDPNTFCFLTLENTKTGKSEVYTLAHNSTADELYFCRPVQKEAAGKLRQSFDYVYLGRKTAGTVVVGTGGGLIYCQGEDGNFSICGSNGYRPDSFVMDAPSK
jgi:hypothetical protein